MNQFWSASIVFFCSELVAILVFWLIRWMFRKETGVDKNLMFSVLKGVLERLVIYIALIQNIPTIVVFFGAIKLGTRITGGSSPKISNDYFLIGNLTSMLIAIGAYAAWMCWLG